MSLACCCVQCMPLVFAINSFKNRIIYNRHHQHRQQQLLEADNGHDGDRDETKFKYQDDHSYIRAKTYTDGNERPLAIIMPATESMFGGLPLLFEEDVQQEWCDATGISEDVMYYTILNLNAALQRSVPCAGWMILYGCLTIPTCGLSLRPLFAAGSRGTRAVEEYLDERNRTVFVPNYGIRWHLRKDLTKPCSWIEIRPCTDADTEQLVTEDVYSDT